MNYSFVPQSKYIPHNYNCKSISCYNYFMNITNLSQVFVVKKRRIIIYFSSVLFCDEVKLCLPQFDLYSEFEIINRVNIYSQTWKADSTTVQWKEYNIKTGPLFIILLDFPLRSF